MLVTVPKVPSFRFPSGWLNWAVLKRLKESPLNCIRKRSAKVLLKLKSITFVAAPVNGFLGESPGAMGVPEASVAAHRRACGNLVSGPIFVNGRGNPISLDALYWRQIRDILKKAGLQWKGWHGFRRGLASNLNRLGVDDSVVQAILRHSNVAVTQRCYIKTTSQDAIAAMPRLSSHVAEIKSPAHLMDIDPNQAVQ